MAQRRSDGSTYEPPSEGKIGQIATSGVIPPNGKIERRDNGVYYVETNGDTSSAVRIDSEKDGDWKARGVELWYEKHLKKAAKKPEVVA